MNQTAKRQHRLRVAAPTVPTTATTVVRSSTPAPHRQRARRLVRGFTLIELIIALSISALLAIFAQSELARQSENNLAMGSGTYIQQVTGASEQYVLQYFNNLSTGAPVAGVASEYAPTIAELKTAGFLYPGFPAGANALPTRQSIQINVNKLNCPGPACTFLATVCTTTPVTLGGTYTRFDLAQTIVDQQQGSGGQSLQTNPSVILGPVLNTPNPFGSVAGITCGSSNVSTALWQQFVRIGDTRDPNLQGNLTVAGNINFNTTPGASTTINGPTTVQNNLAVAGTSNLQGNVTAGSNLAVAGSAVVTGSVAAGGTVNGSQIQATGVFMPGTACVNSGAIGQSITGNGSLVLCAAGAWTPLSTIAAAGAACPVEGQGAVAANGSQLYCTNGTWTPLSDFLPVASNGAPCLNPGQVGYEGVPGLRTADLCRKNPADGVASWYRFQDITTNLVFVTSLDVYDGETVTKPVCDAGAGSAPIAIPQLFAMTESSRDAGFSRFVTDMGTSWQVHLLDGSGQPLTSANLFFGGTPPGSAVAVMHIYCYYP
ncbi:MAG: prepilin-type N-terminal cleavage/methylation domain-containing protein [Burkholderiaceae bacterium]|nr:MAG: prepilin-type N-terminal cleavage/methylation domain-containing protein [Burkholderiaceae bacterium]TBR76816.1 MAG: prepilin-type N-terminal cleavage/methylation domain-containing protein [Burkholderiaceae bacterium]